MCWRVDRILQPAVQNGQFSIIAALSSHAKHVALHANRLEALSPNLAALRGNLALACEKRGRYVDAISLLENELVLIDQMTVIMTLLKIKTLLQLCYVLIQAGRTFEEILSRITETVEALESFEPTSAEQHEQLPLQWINLRVVVDGLRQHESDAPIVALRVRIGRSVNQMSAQSGDSVIGEAVSCVAEAADLN